MTDAKFNKLFVAVNGAVPLALLGWDAFHHQLGANPPNFAIRTTGILILIFLPLSLLITPLRKLTGWNWLISVRRMLGLYAFFYACIHFAIFFVFDRAMSISGTLHEIWARNYLIVGTIGLVAMAPLAVTSTNKMIKRLGTAKWQALHRLAYVAVIAGVVHYYMQAKSDKRQPIAFIAVVAILLGYRIVAYVLKLQSEGMNVKPASRGFAPVMPVPRRTFWSGPLQISRIFEETPNVRTFRLTSPDGQLLPFDYLPGQYLNVSLLVDGKKVHRSYTIASSPTRNSYCEITIKREDLGISSRHLHDQLREGDVLNISAPAGRFTFVGKEAASVVLLGAGVGITPLMSVVRYLTDRCWAGEIFLLYSARTPRDVIFQQELDYLQQRFGNLHVTITLTRAQGAAIAGRIDADLVKRAVPEYQSRLYHICGPSAMIEQTQQMLRTLNIPESQIKSESFIAGSPVESMGASDRQAAELAVAPVIVDQPKHLNGKGEASSVTFAVSGKTAATTGQTVLETAEDLGINIEFECRSGICGTCKTRLRTGYVEMDVQDGLSNSDRASNLILACQAKPVSDIVVEA